MVANYQIQNSEVIEKILNIFRKEAKENKGKFLSRINESSDWKSLSGYLSTNVLELSENKFQGFDLITLIKCLVIGKLYEIPDSQIPQEISAKRSYQLFIDSYTSGSIPGSSVITLFHSLLLNKGVYDELFDMFYEQVLNAQLKIFDDSQTKSKEDIVTDFNQFKSSQNLKMDEKISEIENRIKSLYEKKLPVSLNEAGVENTRKEELKERLMDVEEQIKKLSATRESLSNITSNVSENKAEDKSADTTHLLDKLMSIDQRIKNIYDIASSLETKKDSLNVKDESKHVEKDEQYKNLYNTLDNTASPNEIKNENVVKNKLKTIDEKINEIKESLSSLYTEKAKVEEIVNKQTEVKEPIIEKENLRKAETLEVPKVENPEEYAKRTEEIRKVMPHGAIVLTPRAKKEGIFNDVNLTEDYELGYRFYELGFKTGFFNVKLDKEDEATRIAVAEFFPNDFWPAVKQRSRWIAGICFQNWKAHKWKGNFATKYFLFRDRKSIFSFFGAFLSNIVILYFLYAVIAHMFHFKHVYSLVSHSSVIWYLMLANLFFMISRASHRFIFTYNWYGFKYAFFSFFRLMLDTFVNFFAIIRSIKVFRQTKTKVVWDATTHY